METEEMTSKTALDFLKEEFEARKKQVPRFSLRTFAKFLGVSPATVSQVMSGQRAIGPRLAVTIANRCAFDESKKSAFLSAAIGSDVHVERVGIKDQEFRLIKEQEFASLARWYHFAILSLSELKEARFDSQWIAKRLNISVEEADAAMKDLLALGFVDIKGERFRQSVRPLRTRSDVPSVPLRELHRQLMEKANQSLSTMPVEYRDITAMTMAVNMKRVQGAKRKIKEFRRNMADFLSEGTVSEVYALQVSLIPLSTVNEDAY